MLRQSSFKLFIQNALNDFKYKAVVAFPRIPFLKPNTATVCMSMMMIAHDYTLDEKIARKALSTLNQCLKITAKDLLILSSSQEMISRR